MSHNVYMKAGINTPYTSFRLIRILTGLSVRSFAKLLNISHTYWNDLESGNRKNPSEELIKRISEVTGLSEEVIIFLTEENHPGTENAYNHILGALEDYIRQMKLNEIAK